MADSCSVWQNAYTALCVAIRTNLLLAESAMGTVLKIQNVGQIKKADIRFGDLTVFVGPQATGKSIALQFLKFLVDTGYIQAELRRYGIDWEGKIGGFLRRVLRPRHAGPVAGRHKQNGLEREKTSDANRSWAQEKSQRGVPVLCTGPAGAHFARGWPRPFADYTAGDPFVVRSSARASDGSWRTGLRRYTAEFSLRRTAQEGVSRPPERNGVRGFYLDGSISICRRNASC